MRTLFDCLSICRAFVLMATMSLGVGVAAAEDGSVPLHDFGAAAEGLNAAADQTPTAVATPVTEAEPAGGEPAEAATASEADPAAVVPAVPPAPAKPRAPIVLGGEPDYYAKRATEIVAEDKNRFRVVPHPLSESYPSHYATVCEAGCSGQRKAEVVSLVPKGPEVEVKSAAMVPSSATADGGDGKTEPVLRGIAAVVSDTIDCVAGCYGGVKRYRARAPIYAKVQAPSGEPAAVATPVQTKRKRDPFSPLR